MLLKLLLLASLLGADTDNDYTRVVYFPATATGQLNGVALNAAAATRTVTVETSRFQQGRGDVAAYAKLRLGIALTQSACTTVTSAMTCSYDGGTTYYTRQTRACSSGTCSTYDMTDSNAVSGAETFELEYDIRGCTNVKVLLGGASCGGSDTVITQTVLIVGE